MTKPMSVFPRFRCRGLRSFDSPPRLSSNPLWSDEPMGVPLNRDQGWDIALVSKEYSGGILPIRQSHCGLRRNGLRLSYQAYQSDNGFPVASPAVPSTNFLDTNETTMTPVMHLVFQYHLLETFLLLTMIFYVLFHVRDLVLNAFYWIATPIFVD